MDMLDLYSDYLIFQNKYATATGLSDLVDGAFTHDKVTRFLRLEHFDSKSLWDYVVGRIGTRDFSLVPKTPSKTRRAVYPQRASQSRFTSAAYTPV